MLKKCKTIIDLFLKILLDLDFIYEKIKLISENYGKIIKFKEKIVKLIGTINETKVVLEEEEKQRISLKERTNIYI